MQANPRKLLDLFGNTLRYVVPIFQRHYVWNKERQWDSLWEDIFEKLTLRLKKEKTTPHFLGALILDAVRKQSTREVTRFLVIDGQQRITTTQILLAALRDHTKERHFDKLAAALTRSLFNPDPDLMETSDTEIYKVWPTQFNRKVFCDILEAGSFQRVNQLYPLVRKARKRKYEPRDRLVEAYIYFGERIRDMCTTLSSDYRVEDVLLEIFGVLKDDFAVVEIILDEQDDSQEIFNSLNAKAEPLSQSDLLRSFIFMRAEKGREDRDKLYETYWKRFEETFWDQQIRRGNIFSSQLDVLTRIFLSSRLGQPVDTRKVHLEYKNWIKNRSPFTSVEEEIRAYSRYGDRYRSLLQPSDKDAFRAFADRLRVWDVSTAYPLVIYLFEESGFAESELAEAFENLESFIVRRLVCGKDNKEYNKYFLEIVSKLREDGPSPDMLRRTLQGGKGATREWPNDAEFEHCWRTSRVYGVLTSQQLGLILKIIDDYLRTNKSETVVISQISVEHIMPQQWAENYPLDSEVVPKEMSYNWFASDDPQKRNRWERIRESVIQRNDLIHTFGNLTVVTQPLNLAMSNAPFAQKKAELRNSVLILNRYFDGVDVWDEHAIDGRAKRLFETARLVWRLPS